MSDLQFSISDKLDNISIKLADGSVTNFDPAVVVGFNELNYIEEYEKQASKYIFWSEVYQYAKRVVASENNKLDAIHANLYNQFANNSTDKKRPTKDQIESQIICSNSYQKQRNIVDIYTYKMGIFQSVVKALDQRKDMLIQYGAEMRKENK